MFSTNQVALSRISGCPLSSPCFSKSSGFVETLVAAQGDRVRLGLHLGRLYQVPAMVMFDWTSYLIRNMVLIFLKFLVCQGAKKVINDH